jgi:hypothetical protein
VARLLVLRSRDGEGGLPAIAPVIGQGADEGARAEDIRRFALMHLTLSEPDGKRFSDRLTKLGDNDRRRQTKGGFGMSFTAIGSRREDR